MEYLSKYKKPTFGIVITLVLWVIPSLSIAQTNDEVNQIPPIEQVSQQETKEVETLQYDIPNIDETRIENARIEMINDVRSKNAGYTLDTGLVKTSITWANTLSNERRFKNMHRRPGQKCSGAWCYDFNAMQKRFAQHNIKDRVISESIGYGGYSCKKNDCTEALITATKKTFKFFMSEASRNGPHYRMIVSGKYSRVGFGISQTKASRGNAYIFVMHVSN